ncbi:MAG: hypothetical protein E7652_06035, partial [Ruminococcaceae bacterium]|nr:hypothetical protein [Oscillospiraceae bacterium]
MREILLNLNGEALMKRLLSAVLTVIMLIGILPANAFAATEYPFTDVSQNAWYRDAVEYCHINGLIMGTSDTEFSPDVKLTRAMFVTMLARLAKADLTGCSGSSFTDVKAGSWYAPSVEWAYRNNITGGTGNGKFSPDSPITREQICRFFHNYIKTTDAEVVYDNSIIEKYKDVGEISSWASRDVEFAVANSIINSTSQKELTVSPKVIVTRSQAAQFFMNFKDRFYAEFPLDSKTELDNYCRNNAEIGCNETLLLRWEGETSEIVLSDGSSVMLEKGRRYNITFTRKSSLDISYSAINELTWTLTLDTNGGEMSADSEYIFREDEAYTAVFGSSLPMPEKRGYSFTGWYCEDKEYLLDLKDSFSYEENVTFRALWSANDYTVTFDSNGGKLEGLNEFIVNINDNYYEVLAELCEPSRIGYSFEGWYCDNYKLDLKDDFDYSENIIFKAKWEAKSYKISFENGEEFTVKYDQKISDVITEIPVINKTGYTFVSWFCEDKDYTFDIEDSFTFTDDLILTATWEANSYKIFFENGEEYTVKYDQKFSDIIPVIPYAKRTGYSFLSWYCEGEDYIFSLDDTFRFPNDISFKAKWSANSYTVSFDPNGGSLTGNTVYGIDYDVCWTDVISAEPIPMREGYSFAGWYYGEYRFDIEDSFRFTDDITFVAKWEANSYKIFFENGEEFTVKYDQKISDVITEIPVINKTGYTFVSWFCEDKDYTFDIEDSFTFTDDLILTATWESNTYKISFENGDKFLVKYDQNIGDVIKELPRIEKEGYTFVSWYCESEDYTFDANDIFNFTNDIFFTAEWEANSYMLSFENGDKFLVKYDQRIGDFIKELPKIEKIGYTFISWYCTDKDYTLETDDVFSFTESLYFKAVWEANSYKIFFENGEEYTVKYDQKISDVIKSIPVIEKNGYSFKSWYCEAYNYILNTDDTFVFTEDVSFISKWTPNTYRISFENGEEFTVKYDQKISDVITEIPVINKTGYTFVSWCCDSEDYILDTEDIYNFTESLYFRAVWEANSYKIFFENGEEFTVKYDQKISDIITDYPAIQKTGYTFLSWYCESEDYTFDANDIFNFTNDMFFTAEWEANSYKIFFENGEEFTVKYDQKISDIITDDPEIQKTGYTFLSWYCKSEDYTFDANDIFNFTNDIFFTAEWEANSYMLSFENGEEYTVKYDQKISDIITDDPEIQKTGYTFLSWYCKSEDYTFDANDIF